MDYKNQLDFASRSINENEKMQASMNRCNLIVNYLPQSLKENELNDLFSKIGPIKSCKLIYDKKTGYSYGYGFVEFLNESDAQKAIDTLNGYNMEHKRLKVAYARPNCEETKNTNLYVRNIPLDYDEAKLQSLFSQFGDVIQVRILRDQMTTSSKQIGFVIMATKLMAQHAIQNLNNKIIVEGSNEPIFVKYADEDLKNKQKQHRLGQKFRQNHGNNSDNNFNNIHYQNQSLGQLGNFVYDNGSYPNAQDYGDNFSADQLQQQHFNSRNARFNNNNPLNSNSIGKIKSNRSNGRFNPMLAGGYSNTSNTGNFNQYQPVGYQTSFANQASQLQQNFSSGNNVDSQMHAYHSQQHQDSGSTNGKLIYVYGIGSNGTESDLYALFAKFGQIVRVNVVKNVASGQGKGYGFVLYDTSEEAMLAVQNMNGFYYNNKPLQVQLK